jgi:hypothetical protein
MTFAKCVTHRALTRLRIMRSVPTAMRSVSEILETLGGSTAVAAALDLPFTTVASWKARSSIPVPYWKPLAEAARQRGVRGLTVDVLAELAAKPIRTKRAARSRSRAA